MSVKLKNAIRMVVAGAALAVFSTGAHAAGVVNVSLNNWNGLDNSVGSDDMITTNILAGGLGRADGFTDNPFLNNSGRGHALQWLTFQITAANQIVTIKDQVLTGTNQRGFTVWASNGAFNGGTIDFYDLSFSGMNMPHSFNAVGQLGDKGTTWAADPSIASNGGGNLLRTLAYVNAGKAHTDAAANDWGEVINSGVNQVDNSGTYFTALTGSYSDRVVELVFTNLAPGWYTIASGGANSSLYSANSTDQFTIVSMGAVPLPGAVYLFGTALAGLAVSVRRKQLLV